MITFVGMGPGDPELLTLKAVRAIREAELIAMPDTGLGSSAVTAIAGDLLEGKEILRLYMPMKGGRTAWQDAHQKAVDALAERLERSVRIAYLVLGDPMLYATGSYLLKLLKPRFEVHVIPGVTAMCAAAAELQVPLCEDREKLEIWPGFREGDELPDHNVVVMKAGGHLQEIQEAGAGREIYLARNVGMPNAYLGPLSDADLDVHAYFSTVLLKAGRAAGGARGQLLPRLLAPALRRRGGGLSLRRRRQRQSALSDAVGGA